MLSKINIMVNSNSNLNQRIISLEYINVVIGIFSDLVMSFIPCTFLHIDPLLTNGVSLIYSAEEFIKYVSYDDYIQFLDKLSLIPLDSIVEIINQIMNRLNLTKIIETNINTNVNTNVNTKPIHNEQYIYSSIIIKNVIIGLLKLAVLLDPNSDTISNMFTNPVYWNLQDITKIDIQNIDICSFLLMNLLETEDIIKKLNKMTLEQKQNKSNDPINQSVENYIKRSASLTKVINTVKILFGNFVGYSSIMEDINNELAEIIIITSCDSMLTNKKENQFMTKNSVIVNIASLLNSSYRSILHKV